MRILSDSLFSQDQGFPKDYTGPWGTCRTEKEKSTRAEINIAKIHFQLQRKRQDTLLKAIKFHIYLLLNYQSNLFVNNMDELQIVKKTPFNQGQRDTSKPSILVNRVSLNNLFGSLRHGFTTEYYL